MKKLWKLIILTITLVSVVVLGSLNTVASGFENEDIIISEPIMRTISEDGTGSLNALTYSEIDEDGIVWFTGEFTDTYVKNESESFLAESNRAAAIPLTFNLGYSVVNGRIQMIAKASTPVYAPSAQFYKLTGNHYTEAPSLRSYHSTTNSTRQITCGGRDMGYHAKGTYYVDTEGTAYGFNLQGSGAFFASAYVTVK